MLPGIGGSCAFNGLEAREPGMVPLRVLCVDDEAGARQRLESVLQGMAEVEGVSSAATYDEASQLISEIEPHVMMVEAEFRDGTAFDMFQRLGKDKIPPVVFVASCPRHAVRAFELPALDYILKPARPERLRTALARVGETLQKTAAFHGRLPESGIPHVPADVRECETEDFWVRRNGSGLVRVPAGAIEYATSADDYVCLHVGGREYLVRDSLGAIQRRFPPGEFVRIHRSALVRASLIAEIRGSCSGRRQVVLAGGVRLKVGRVFGRTIIDALISGRSASVPRAAKEVGERPETVG